MLQIENLTECLKFFVFAQLTFSNNLSKPYLQVKVDEECSKYVTIHTHRYLYVLRYLPFGLKEASSLFPQIKDAMLAGPDYAMAYLGGILIKSENAEQDKKHVREVFKRINEYDFKLGLEKCDFFMERMKYLGQMIDQKGRKPDPERAKAIKKNRPSPDNEATSILGSSKLLQYMHSENV